jgi:hypothetical protein
MTSTTITSTEIIATEVRHRLASIGVDPPEVTGRTRRARRSPEASSEEPARTMPTTLRLGWRLWSPLSSTLDRRAAGG